MIDEREIDYFLLRLLLDEIEEGERKQVEAWLAADEKHRAYFREFQITHLKMQWGIQSASVKGNYRQIHRAIVRRRRVRFLSWSAACFILSLGIGCGYWMLRGDGNVTLQVLETVVIQPGKPQAVLHMASGKTVRMGCSVTELKEQDGTRLRINGKGELTYQLDESGEKGQLLYNRITVPRGGEFSVTLTDGTRVWLNAGSELYYPARFPGEKREVFLTGEAYFDVAKDENRPFVVRVNDLSVKVYGTRFNVNAQVGGRVTTVLVEGSVGISCHGREALLKPNQMGEYREEEMSIRICDVDVLPHVAWKDGHFIFRNETLASILEKLALWYDLEVIYTNDGLKDIRLSGNLLRYKDVGELFSSFEKISEARFRVKGKVVTIGY